MVVHLSWHISHSAISEIAKRPQVISLISLVNSPSPYPLEILLSGNSVVRAQHVSIDVGLTQCIPLQCLPLFPECMPAHIIAKISTKISSNIKETI